MVGQCFKVPRELGQKRLDWLVANFAHISRRVARLLIADGHVQINGRVTRILTKPVAAGATLHIHVGDRAPANTLSHAFSHTLPIVYQDTWMIGINKPAGLLSESNRFGSPSVESLLPKQLQTHRSLPPVWLVHRLDAGTTGVMVLARTPMAAQALSECFRLKTAQKTYFALCAGHLNKPVEVDIPIGRIQGTKHGHQALGKPAQTLIEPLSLGTDSTLVRATPRTGRTHQIRVHMAHIGHPLLGDRLYEGPMHTNTVPAVRFFRPMLHAYRLILPHPKHHQLLTLQAAVPGDWLPLMQHLKLACAW